MTADVTRSTVASKPLSFRIILMLIPNESG
jgi:hypothetical protein